MTARVPTRTNRDDPSKALGLPARRPAYSALASELGMLLPPLDEALTRYAAERVA